MNTYNRTKFSIFVKSRTRVEVIWRVMEIKKNKIRTILQNNENKKKIKK